MGKVFSLFFLGISIIFAAIFVVARYFVTIRIPFVPDIDKQLEIVLLAAYASLLIGVVSLYQGRRRESGSAEKDDAGPAWPKTFGTLATIVSAAVAVITFWHGYQKSLDTTALQLFVELDKTVPPNVRPCRCTVAKLDLSALELLLKREPVPLADAAAVLAGRCFSDKSQKDLNEFISDKALTRLGAWTLADRTQRFLNADDNYAHAIVSGLGRREVIEKQMRQAFAVDKVIIGNLKKIREFEDYPLLMLMDPEASSKSCDVP